ncbi:MAG: sugar-binding protein [Clostridia bacterium]|nr:sugar-binding protein [Clostridia bacterium]
MRILKASAGTILILLLMVMTFACAEAAAVEVSYGSPLVDGIKDALYDSMKPIETKKVIEGSSIDDPSSAKVWLSWDNEGLYAYAEVKEITPANEASEEYKQDSIEIFTDEDNSKSKIIDKNDTQYRVTSLGSRTLGNAASDSFLSAVSSIEGGYVVEVKLPWLEIMPADGTVIGFDILVNDALGAVRQGMRAWSTQDNTNYVSTQNYGEIKLVTGENYVPWNGSDPLRISVNGYRLDCMGTSPVVKNGRTLVPMRAVFEALSCGVTFNEEEKAVYAIGNGKFIRIVIDSDTVYVNNEPQKLEAAAEIVNGRTLVPLRFVAETLGAAVEYDERQGAVFINK